MKKGAYLKDNKDTETQSFHQLAARTQQTRKEKALRRQVQRRQLWMMSAILAVILVAIIIVAVLLFRTSPLEGAWMVDEVTTYSFYDEANGALVLPSANYPFTYTVEDNIISIDFEYDGAKDAQYIFVIEGDTLTLEGGNNTNQGKLLLKKIE